MLGNPAGPFPYGCERANDQVLLARVGQEVAVVQLVGGGLQSLCGPFSLGGGDTRRKLHSRSKGVAVDFRQQHEGNTPPGDKPDRHQQAGQRAGQRQPTGSYRRHRHRSISPSQHAVDPTLHRRSVTPPPSRQTSRRLARVQAVLQVRREDTESLDSREENRRNHHHRSTLMNLPRMPTTNSRGRKATIVVPEESSTGKATCIGPLRAASRGDSPAETCSR